MRMRRPRTGIYNPGQASHLFKFWPAEAKWFILGGPGNANEAQTVKAQYPNIQCLGFEPNPLLFRQQKELAFPGELLPVALWDGDIEEMEFILDVEHPLSSSCCRPGMEGEKITVQARSLDSLNEEFGPFENVVLWLDVEYAEERALLGAHHLMKNGQILLINLEAWDRPHSPLPELNTYRPIVELLEEYGFEEINKWSFTIEDKADVVFRYR